MSARRVSTKPRRAAPTLREVCDGLERIAPTALAQSWDNVGLLAGDPNATVRRAMLCIDLMPAVVTEAISADVQLIVAYHPPIFKPVGRLLADSRETDSQVFDCIAAGIAIYSLHTAYDAADGGTNDVIAELCGIDPRTCEPLEFVDQPGERSCKLVVFTPISATERVAEAVSAAGAGIIGQYRRCSFRGAGTGTFEGSDATNPAVGRAGVYEKVDEIRLETIVPHGVLPAVIDALRAAHPYEEPAYDIYPLDPSPVRGIGRVGRLPRPITLIALARKLKKAAQAAGVQVVGQKDKLVRRAVILVGAAGSLPFRVGLGSDDVVITGEIRHHDALTIRRHGAAAVALGHWSSERPGLGRLADRMRDAMPSLDVQLSDADHEPFVAG
ncbi:MAG: Nif3-like dinuclear metal center hexameric protein [Planctomycetes bacterium]|nr:Nif3-like dinuclear metal center hexameric protein [Planctomycetota bacterium]